MLVRVAATLNDRLPWLIFSVVLGDRSGGHSLNYMLALTVGFVSWITTLGR